jgi:hypothetical protein
MQSPATEPTKTSYGIDGTIAQDKELIFAQTVVDQHSGRKSYFVRVSRTQHGSLLNPYVDGYLESYMRANHPVYGEMYPFRSVDEKVFNCYLDFLRTKNPLLFIHLQRMMT